MSIFNEDKFQIIKVLQTNHNLPRDEKIDLLKMLLSNNKVKLKDIMFLAFSNDPVERKAFTHFIKRNRLDKNDFLLFLNTIKEYPGSRRKLVLKMISGESCSILAEPINNYIKNNSLDKHILSLIFDLPDLQEFESILLTVLDMVEHSLRLKVLDKLKDINPEAIIRIFPKFSKTKDDNIKQKLIELIISNTKFKDMNTLISFLKEASLSQKNKIAQRLLDISQEKKIDLTKYLIPLLSDSDDHTRIVSLEILLKLESREHVLKTIIHYFEDLPGWIRERALVSLKAYSEHIIKDLLSLLKDPDPDTRATAMIIASNFPNSEVAKHISKLLNDPDWWIRITAAEILGDMGIKDIIPDLIKALEDPDARWAATEALGKIKDPRAIPSLSSLIADASPDVRIEAINALKKFDDPNIIKLLSKIASEDKMVSIRTRAMEAIKELKDRMHLTIENEGELERRSKEIQLKKDEPLLNKYLIATRNQNASDLHLSVGIPPKLRFKGDLINVKGNKLSSEDIKNLIFQIINDYQINKLKKYKFLDFCHYIPNVGRYRANVFYDQKGLNAVFRVISDKPPTLHDIGLPDRIASIVSYHQGLVIICGPSSSGKSTTLNALINLINEFKRDHILTIEDPVEFVHPFKNSLINQREIGKHTVSYAKALRAALREDPDVIVIGELRDPESISLALTAAETGHVVFCTMNSTNAVKAIDRLISSFPQDQQAQIRISVSESLKLVISQYLLKSKDEKSMVAAFEILMGTHNVLSLIRENKILQIGSIMEIGRGQGHQSFDIALLDLYNQGKITAEVAYSRARKKDIFSPYLEKNTVNVNFND